MYGTGGEILEEHMDASSRHLEALRRGETVRIRPRGQSMHPKVKDRALVTVAPCRIEDLKVGDIVLVRVRGNVYLHLIKAIDGKRCLIGNNHGRINGWAGPHAVYGIAVAIE
jgi:hypothetical protein